MRFCEQMSVSNERKFVLPQFTKTRKLADFEVYRVYDQKRKNFRIWKSVVSMRKNGKICPLREVLHSWKRLRAAICYFEKSIKDFLLAVRQVCDQKNGKFCHSSQVWRAWKCMKAAICYLEWSFLRHCFMQQQIFFSQLPRYSNSHWIKSFLLPVYDENLVL